jgi:acyl-CoA thioesterase FadM
MKYPLGMGKEMDTTTLKSLLKSGNVTCSPEGLRVTVNPKWIVEGEDRLSYTTLIRLVECCRELHWNSDILIHTKGTMIDSVTKLIRGDFLHPILPGNIVSITYHVTAVRQKSYELRFDVQNVANGTLCATFNIVSVFYDPILHEASVPPKEVLDYLCNLTHVQKSKDN